MQIGFNNDVEHAGTRYHVQTEDHGLADGRITSQVFRGGQILDTMTVSYSKAIEGIADEDARDEVIRKRMKALHAHGVRNIKKGKYEQSEGASTGAVAPAAAAATVEPAPGAAILDKPKMPAEPAPAPGLARVRPLTGLRQPPPAQSEVENGDGHGDRHGEGVEDELTRTVSDTAEDDAIPLPPGYEHLLAEEVGEAVGELLGDESGDEPPDDDFDPTGQMLPLPDELPEGVVVAGDRGELGEDFVLAYSRGEVMDLEALPDESGLGRSRTRQKARRFSPTYSPARAFRGLDAVQEYDLPALLERLGH